MQQSMGHIAIKLDPSKLANPDADIRYRVPDLIAAHTDNRVADDGYDYDDEDIMTVFLRCPSPTDDVKQVLNILREHSVCNNALLDTAVIGVSDGSAIFQIVHPPDQTATFVLEDWE